MQNVSKQRKNAAQLKLQASKKETPKKAPRKINSGRQYVKQSINCSTNKYEFVYKDMRDAGYDDDEIKEIIDSFKSDVGEEIVKMADGNSENGGIWWSKDKNGEEKLWECVGQKGGGFRWYEVTEDVKKNSNKDTKTNSSKKPSKTNAAKQVEGEWFYSLSDVETVVAAVLEELDKDNGAAITLEASETGIMLNVTSSEGEEFTVPVDLGIEGDEAPEGDVPVDDMPVEDEYVEEEEYVEE